MVIAAFSSKPGQRTEIVPRLPARRPPAPSTDSHMRTVLVLPLVPVTPTSDSARAGNSKKRAATSASARRVSATTATPTSAGRSAGGSSTSSALAPARSASGMKRWPSVCAPRSAANSAPGRI